MLLDGGESLPRHAQDIKRYENEADEITREVLLAVRRTFITPFDRGDIRDLITVMDDTIDQMHQTAKATLLYETREFEAPMRRMGDIIVKAAELTRTSIPLLRSMAQNAGRLNAFSEAILRLEDEADDIHDQGLTALFHTHQKTDPMAFIVGAEIYGQSRESGRWLRGCGKPGNRHRSRTYLGASSWTARFYILSP